MTSMISMPEQLGWILSPDPTIAITLGAVFAGSLVSGLAGFAFSAIAGALLLHWLSPSQAVPLLLACSITCQLFSIAKLRHAMQWRRCAPFMVGGLAGIPFGAMLLSSVDGRIFAAGFGGFLVCYSAYMLLRPNVIVQRGGRLVDVAAGFAGGITGGAIAFPGAIPTAWCSLRGLSKQEQRGIVQPFILFMQIATLVYFSRLGILGSAAISTYLWCVPAVIGGTWVGVRLFDRIDDARFRRIVLMFLMISGATLVI